MALFKSLLAMVAAALLMGSAADADFLESSFWIGAIVVTLGVCAIVVVVVSRSLHRPPDVLKLERDRQDAKKPPLIPGRHGERFADHDDYLDWVKRRGRWTRGA